MNLVSKYIKEDNGEIYSYYDDWVVNSLFIRVVHPTLSTCGVEPSCRLGLPRSFPSSFFSKFTIALFGTNTYLWVRSNGGPSWFSWEKKIYEGKHWKACCAHGMTRSDENMDYFKRKYWPKIKQKNKVVKSNGCSWSRGRSSGWKTIQRSRKIKYCEDLVVEVSTIVIDPKEELEDKDDVVEVPPISPNQAINVVISDNQDKPIEDSSKETLPRDNSMLQKPLTTVIVHPLWSIQSECGDSQWPRST